MQFTPVKELALEHGIEVLQPIKVREPEMIEKLRSYNADLIAVTAFGQLLPEDILNMPKYGCINVHGSLLPEYRGAAPMQRAIIDGKKVTGITTMFMAKGMDTGDMLLKKEVEIMPTDNFEDLHDKMAVAGADLLLETIDGLEAGTIELDYDEEGITILDGNGNGEGLVAIREMAWNYQSFRAKYIIQPNQDYFDSLYGGVKA